MHRQDAALAGHSAAAPKPAQQQHNGSETGSCSQRACTQTYPLHEVGCMQVKTARRCALRPCTVCSGPPASSSASERFKSLTGRDRDCFIAALTVLQKLRLVSFSCFKEKSSSRYVMSCHARGGRSSALGLIEFAAVNTAVSCAKLDSTPEVVPGALKLLLSLTTCIVLSVSEPLSRTGETLQLCFRSCPMLTALLHGQHTVMAKDQQVDIT
jgi:hypothetical protein